MAQLNLTYKAIIDDFIAATNEHEGINQFDTGTIDYLNANAVNKMYPYVFLRPISSGGVDRDSRTRTLSFEMYVMDVPSLSDESPVSLISKTEMLAYDLLAWFDRGAKQQTYSVTMTSLVPVNEAFEDRVYGWMASIEVEVPFVLDYCSYPKLP